MRTFALQSDAVFIASSLLSGWERNHGSFAVRGKEVLSSLKDPYWLCGPLGPLTSGHVGPILVVKRPERETGHSSTSNVAVKISGAVTLLH